MISSVRRALLIVVLLCSAPCAAAEAWRDANARLWAAMEERDLPHLRALCSGSLYEPPLAMLRLTTSTYSFIAREHVEATPLQTSANRVVAQVDVDGEG